VIGNLLRALPEATVIFTSHRVSSLRLADQVVVLSKGQLLQEGHPDRLLQVEGYFRDICQQQDLLQEIAQLGGEEKE